jgi:hypothetical protein
MRTPDATDGPAADSIRVDRAGLARLAAKLKAFLDSADQAVSESANAYRGVETEIGRAASSGAR